MLSWTAHFIMQKPQYSIYLNVRQRQVPTLGSGNQELSSVHIPKLQYYVVKMF
jgi:hypothetical protein